MAHWLIKYETRGTPVYESETGPDIGYDNVETGFLIVPDDYDEVDYETYRKFDVVAELSDGDARALHATLTNVVAHLDALREYEAQREPIF